MFDAAYMRNSEQSGSALVDAGARQGGWGGERKLVFSGDRLSGQEGATCGRQMTARAAALCAGRGAAGLHSFTAEQRVSSDVSSPPQKFTCPQFPPSKL